MLRGAGLTHRAPAGWAVVWLGVLFWVALSVMSVSAANAKGTHFIAELNNGLSVPLGYEGGYEAGYALGVTVGVGGKFKAYPTRFYLLGQFNTSSFSADRVFNDKRRLVDRQVTDVSGGLRMLWPVNQRLRAFAEFGLGFAQIDSTASSPDLPGRIILRNTETDLALFTAAGLQYRLLEQFSLGVKADFAFVADDDEVDVVTSATSRQTGAEQVGRLNLYLTTTLHF